MTLYLRWCRVTGNSSERNRCMVSPVSLFTGKTRRYTVLVTLTDGPEGADPSIGPDGLAQIGAGQVCAGQVGLVQVDVYEVGVSQDGVSQVSAFQVCALQVDPLKIGVAQVHLGALRIGMEDASIDDQLGPCRNSQEKQGPCRDN